MSLQQRWRSKCCKCSQSDIVLIHEEKPHGFWKMTRVIDLVTGWYGQVRGAILEVTFALSCSTILEHSIRWLYPLKVKISCDSHQDEVQPIPRELQTCTSVDAKNSEKLSTTKPQRNPSVDAKTLRARARLNIQEIRLASKRARGQINV